jgi:hypothetical protein
MISICTLSTFLTYVEKVHRHLHVVFISRSWFGIQINVCSTYIFLLSRLYTAFGKFYGRYSDLICQCNLPLCRMLSDVFHVKLIRYQFWCTRCAFRLLKSLQWYSGRKGWKSKKGKVWKLYKSRKNKYCSVKLSQIRRTIELCMRETILHTNR